MSDIADKVDEVVTAYINGPDWWVDDALPEAVLETVFGWLAERTSGRDPILFYKTNGQGAFMGTEP